MIELELKPLLFDITIPGGRIPRMWQGPVNAAGIGIEVSEIVLAQSPTASRLRQAWQARRAGQARPVILFVTVDANQVLICGPEGTPPPVATLPSTLAQQIFATVLRELPVPATRHALELLDRAQGSGAVPGFRNRSLVSTHYVTQVIQRGIRVEWGAAAAHGEQALGKSGATLIRALGYHLDATGPKEYRVQDEGTAVAVAHIYDDLTSLDRVGTGQAAPPATIALKRARELGLDHALLVAGSLIRIYSLRGQESLGEGAASAAYVEFDTNLLPTEWAPLLGALAAPDALRANGRLERLRAESGRYAVGLRERFTKRLYEEVVDQLVRGIHAAAQRSAVQPQPNEVSLYRATLVLLFRLLFLLYAEDRDLLPMSNSEYRAHSITRMVMSAADRKKAGQLPDPTATSMWADLRQLFAAVTGGNADWGVPPYGGDLFVSDDMDQGLLRRIKLPNSVIGPALLALGWDEGRDGDQGKIDFSDLGVRHLGTMYEGLLSYEVAFATENLRVDHHAPGEPYVTALPGEPPDVLLGAPHIRSPQGGRKATGSYYTPTFAVDRLVDKTLRPALAAHFSRVGTDLDLSSAELMDFRVADIAMGSGHFLVSALDALTEGFATFLAAHPNRGVRTELDRARERLNTVGHGYGAPGLGDRVADVDLLRRIVLKRCIYGVDLNPMAVELARLGLWLHSLVPGLPLSYLGANLQHGNSLVGVGAEVASTGLWGHQFEDQAASLAMEVDSIYDLELGDIERELDLQAKLDVATAGLHDYYDVETAIPLVDRDLRAMSLSAEAIIERRPDPRIAPDLETAKAAARAHAALHWRLAFPAIFLRREQPGFDVILGNPPWEEITVERLGFFSRYLPGIKSVKPQTEQERRIVEFEATHPDIRQRYEEELAEKAALRRYVAATYTLTRSGDPDLYKAFAERFLSLVRIDGYLGVVLPRSAFADDGTTPFREKLFNSATETTLDVLLNSAGWVFPDAEHRYTLVLLACHKGLADVRTLSVSVVASNRSAFDHIDEERTTWTLSQLKKPHPDLAVPLLPSLQTARLYQRVVTQHPRFDSDQEGWRAIPWAELHVTNDRKSGLLKEPGSVEGEAWPVYSGRSFDLWQPEAWRLDGDLGFVLEPEVGLGVLQEKRQHSSVWRQHFLPDVLRDPATLPQHGPRILFRDVTNRTNSRTCIVCMVPPHVFAANTAPALLWPKGDARDQAYVLGVMASVPFDWFARRRVELHLNFFILNSLPVPRPENRHDDPRWNRVVELASRLACVDARYGSFAAATGVTVEAPAPDVQATLIAELDAVVAHLYGLDREELELMFEDFPVTVAGVSPGRRAAVLEHFARWAT